MQPSYRIAIVGAGPAGFYAAEHLLKSDKNVVAIDIIDRLPTPYGLVRAGVAPDHPKIKNVTAKYAKTLENPSVRFIGGVNVGTTVTVEDLQDLFDGIILTTGAQLDRSLGIDGESLSGSHSATEFVAWYNGHPDFSDRSFDLSAKAAVVVGVGNVAMDLARILCRSIESLRKTDIADYALEALASSKVEDIYLLGRRGPAQAAFTNPEIKEVGELEEADVVVSARDMILDEHSTKQVDADRLARKKIDILRGYAEKEVIGKRKRMHFRFLTSPTKIVGEDGRVIGVETVRNELFETEDGRIRPRATNETDYIPAALVFRSVGYRGEPIADVPFRDDWGTIPHDSGRVLGNKSDKIPGLYTAGWIKRGPSGVIGTNKADAIETVKSFLQDIDDGSVKQKPRQDFVEFLDQKGIDFYSTEDWNVIDNKETERGLAQGRPRIKFTNHNDFADAIRTRN